MGLLYIFLISTLNFSEITNDVQIIYLLLFALNNAICNLFTVVAIFLFFYYRAIISLLFFYKTTLFVTCFMSVNLPIKLLIGYYALHPLCFYLSFVSILLLFQKKKKIFYISIRELFFFIVLSFLLGAYWSLGNSVWGFLWVNDCIEFCLLLFIFLIVSYTHTHFYTKNFSTYSFIIVFVMLLLFFLRFGLIFSRHSFFDIDSINNEIVFFFAIFNISHTAAYFFFFLFGWYIIFMFYCVLFLSYLMNTRNIFKKSLFFYHVFLTIIGFMWVKFFNLNLTIQGHEKFINLQMFTIKNGTFSINNIVYIENMCTSVLHSDMANFFSSKFQEAYKYVIAPYLYAIVFSFSAIFFKK